MSRLAQLGSRLGLALALAASVLASGCGKHAAGSAQLVMVPSEASPRATGAFSGLSAGLLGVKPRDVVGLTREEAELVNQDLLPSNYATLVRTMNKSGVDAARAQARRGLSGPFSSDFGDPGAMLAAARFAAGHTGYRNLLARLHRGDLVFLAPNDPQGFVVKVSGGPFDHVMICTDPAPPGQFVEAIGITGDPKDDTADRVRRTTLARYTHPDYVYSFRLLHPAGGSDEVVDKAIAYSEAQLGKPYNYTFSDDLAGERGFYCSSLVYKAYRAAGVNWQPDKDPARDRIAQAIINPVMALQPDDALGVSVELMTLLHTQPAVDNKAFASFLVRRLLPSTKKTARIVLTETQKAALEKALAKVLEGQAFPRYGAALAKYHAAENDGKFAHKVLGPGRKVAAQALLAEECAKDAVKLVAEAKLNTVASLKAMKLLLGNAMPYADALSAFITGPDSGATQGAVRFLDLLDGIRVVATGDDGSLEQSDLPGRAPWKVLPDLESPTDLAWSAMPHEDFNPMPLTPIAAPWPHALVASDGRFGGARNADAESPILLVAAGN